MLATLPNDVPDTSAGGLALTPAQEERYATIRRELIRAVRAVCPPWLRERSEDVVQNALLRVYNLDRRAEAPRDLAASYLWKVAYSATVDEMRRVGGRPDEVPLAEVGEPAPSQSDAGPERRAAGRQLGEAITGCLGAMVDARRHAVSLYLFGHNVPQAAKLLGWGRKRVENLVFRGLADLRRCLENKGFHP